MRFRYVILFLALLTITISAFFIPIVNSPERTLRVAFYNVENLFDTLDEKGKIDEEFLPTSPKQWNSEKYNRKLENIAKVLNKLNADIIGLCEVEDYYVLRDLIKKMGGGWYTNHLESDDARGIDVAFLFKDKFKHIIGHGFEVEIEDEPYYKTRLINTMTIEIEGDTFTFLGCHLHSRREGVKESEKYRLAGAGLLANTAEYYAEKHKTIIVGDFNDNPEDSSLNLVESYGFINPASEIDRTKEGSCIYKGEWNMYDQILYSNNGGLKLNQFSIFHPEWLTNQTGWYKDFPFRTYAGDNYLGGYSDHFPVIAEFMY